MEPIHVDKDLCSELPDTCQLISVQPHGESFWATTGRIIVEADGSGKSFFVKLLSSDIGRRMVESEYESAKTISTVCPTFVPAAVGFGSLRGTPEVHFFIATFFEMGDQMPVIGLFTKRLALLHQSDSPNGKFGFHLETYNGNLSQATQWEDSWAIFFAKSLRRALDHEIAAKGHDDEFATLIPQVFDVVIPRLLRPLESEGRRVRPVLVHGDLWYANSGVDSNGRPLVFDACCFYAHNEYEFGQWMPACNKSGQDYLDSYHSMIPKSAPEEDYGGRLELYKLRFNTHVSALFVNDAGLRSQMLADMRSLVSKYGSRARGQAMS